MFRKRTGVLILICVGLVLYINSLTNAFLGDDRSQILGNLQVHSLFSIGNFFLGSTYYNGGLSKLTGLYYRPLMLTAYDLIYSFFGADPFPFHIVQVGIHIINTILVFIVFEVFFPIVPAFFLSLLFLVHPINNEAVVYVANLQDVLFVFFGLLGTLFIVKNKAKQYSPKEAIAFAFFILLSLFTKETGVVFIGTILLFLILFPKKNNKFISLASFFAFGLYIFFRYFVAHIGITQQQAIAPIATATVSQKLLTLPVIIFLYLRTFFFPLQLSSSYYWIITSANSVEFFLSFCFVIIFFLTAFFISKWIVEYHRKYAKQFFFFFAWFLLGLIPHLQIIPLDTTIAERWFYFSCIGLLGAIGTIITCVIFSNFQFKKIGYIAINVIILLFSLRTFLRNFDWADGVTLYSQDIKVTKQSFLLDNALATELLYDGDYEKAKPYVLSSIRQFPFFANLNNAAVIALHEKNIPLTKYYLQQALIRFGNYAVYENYANFLVAYYSPRQAYSFSKTALLKYPEDPKILFDLGKSSLLLGKTQEALAAAEKSYKILPQEKTKELVNEIEQIKK